MSWNIANYIPAFRQKKITTTTWGSNPNTLVITDANITTNSQIEIWVTGTSQQAAGNWSYNYAVGSVTITSSGAESSTLPLAYYIN